MIYEYKGPGSLPNSKSYTITLKIFRDEDCVSCASMPTSVTIGIFSNNNSQLYGGYQTIPLSYSETVPINPLPPCITNPPTLVYKVGYYIFNIDLPDNALGYTAAYQTCCRIDGIMNVPNSIGATFTTQIPGLLALGATGTDSSPQFFTGISVVCFNKPFTLDFSAIDPNPEDSLVYSFCGAYSGGAATDANYNTPAPPSYPTLAYTNGFTGNSPLGTQATINTRTGIISGIAPGTGKYVVSVCVSSYREGEYISTHRKDFIVTVAPCDLAGAQLQPSYLSCDGFTFDFTNLNNSILNTSFLWDFSDGFTSNLENPSHTYNVAGIYTIKLVVNQGSPCSDSATSQLKVFPGYFPGFTNNSPMCKGIPVSFQDATIAAYGAPNSWIWDFGDPSVSTDVSTIKNPSYTYSTAGSYVVSLVVGSDKGCTGVFRDTIKIVDKPQLKLTNDTLICSIDTLQLNAQSTSGGNITWSPDYNISNTSSFNPQVWPAVTTTYLASYSDNFGCSTTAQVKVSVVDSVTLLAMPDTTICTSDQLTLQVNSDALQYSWTPANSLNNPQIKNPVATPPSSTLYTVKGSIGKCTSTDQVLVKTVAYPNAVVSPEAFICFGSGTQLSASGGSIYSWTPANYLSSPNIPNPRVINPPISVTYTVSVRDTLGCPKPVFKTVRVNVIKIQANAGPADTSVVLGQPLQLMATGSLHYSWFPGTWLNNPSISNPLALPQDNILYTVRVSDDAGCFGTDSILVKVYKIAPDLLVPTAFTPNGDGNNDVFRPIPIGMKSLDAFRVYNRWGQLLFSTTQQGLGWDGTIKGNPQDAGTFVWYAEGTDYLGKRISRKGFVVLIR